VTGKTAAIGNDECESKLIAAQPFRAAQRPLAGLKACATTGRRESDGLQTSANIQPSAARRI